MRFNKINAQFLLFHKIQPISPRKFIQIIDEHNQLSLSIRELNSILNKSVASLFIITAFVIACYFDMKLKSSLEMLHCYQIHNIKSNYFCLYQLTFKRNSVQFK